MACVFAHAGEAPPPLPGGQALTLSVDSPANSLRGQFRPVNFTVLSAGIDGKLASFDVKTGSTLRKGDLIAKFSCDEERAEHRIAVAKVSVAQKNLEVNRKLNRYQNISEFDLKKSEADLEIANAEAGSARAILGQCEITSPFNATVTDKQVQAFQYVRKGEPLLEIVDTENLEIEMILPSIDVTRYARGRRFSITVDETGQTVSAEVDRTVNVIDPVSQTVRVIGRLTGPVQGLMPGMSGVVRFEDH